MGIDGPRLSNVGAGTATGRCCAIRKWLWCRGLIGVNSGRGRHPVLLLHGDGNGIQNRKEGRDVSQNRRTSIAVVESYSDGDGVRFESRCVADGDCRGGHSDGRCCRMVTGRGSRMGGWAQRWRGCANDCRQETV